MLGNVPLSSLKIKQQNKLKVLRDLPFLLARSPPCCVMDYFLLLGFLQQFGKYTRLARKVFEGEGERVNTLEGKEK